jgi:hypothetical protein
MMRWMQEKKVEARIAAERKAAIAIAAANTDGGGEPSPKQDKNFRQGQVLFAETCRTVAQRRAQLSKTKSAGTMKWRPKICEDTGVK